MTELLVFAVMPKGTLSRADLPRDTGLPTALRLIEGDAYSAVTGDAPPGGLAGLERSAILPWLLAGQTVMDHLRRHGCALPVSLGSLAEDEMRLAQALHRGAPALDAAFDMLGTRQEMNLAVRWPVETVVSEVVAAFPAALRDRAAAGTGDALDAVATRLGEEITVRRKRIRQRVVERLEELTEDIIETQPSDPAGVVDVALLLEPSAETALDAVLEELDGEFDGRLTFRLVGPLAPYNFASVQLHLPARHEIAAARALLGVGEDDPEIKTAYRRAALGAHQDLALSRGDVEVVEAAGPDRMVAITAAYRTLLADAEPISIRRQEAVRD
ncbi:GvpL/GvpF family gas vesicle protein [Segnochrobactrum spirostomi]|uniref:Uncharacterized protein n=1 Tax=Segnochrobactrum spirostomi TaxID=2608987 RepID=A0A6A7Y7U7_9HYPH|nr:GvpL/GvpF family gas vesicle protein [Segnochrobactrum spirostomi]MQT14765.1 hypothetical protein [Segnochrobactrum spirostomi]